MVYIYLPAVYYNLNLDVTKLSLLAGAAFPCPSSLSCFQYIDILCNSTGFQEDIEPLPEFCVSLFCF